MLVGAHYGHVIKHIEPAHLSRMPLVTVDPTTADWFEARVRHIFDKRDAAHSKEAAAFDDYERALAARSPLPNFDEPTVVRASELFLGRRRLEAFHYNPNARAVASAVQAAPGRDRLADLTMRIFAPSRFRRHFGPNGVRIAAPKNYSI
jgi:hypothetical protein